MLVSTTAENEKLLFIDDQGLEFTYGDFRSFLDQFEQKIPEGRHLAVLFARNSGGSLLSYLACLESMRVVPLVLDAGMSEETYKPLLECYKPELVFAPAGHAALEGGQELFSFHDYELRQTGAEPCELFADLGLLLSTSGSTGDSKLVRLSYSNILANAQSIVEYLEIDSHERAVTSLPMNYTYGLSVINSHVLAGATLLLTDVSVLQRPFWDFMSEQAATSFAGVPYTYQMLKRLRIMQMDLPALKTLTQAGGRLGPELHEEFGRWAAETDRRFFIMYGQTEATARMSYLPWDKCLDKVGSIGIAIPGGRFDLLDEDGTAVESGEDGELVYTGANVSLGYARTREDLAKGDEREGVLHTGDIARCDEDGYYYVTGRASRFLKLFGKRTNLVSCEEMVEHKFGCTCVCSGHDDLLVAYVTQEGIEDDVRSYLSESLGVHPSAVRSRYIAEIPRSSSGKVLYSELEL